MQILGEGALSKMRAELGDVVRYQLSLGDQLIEMNELLGKRISLSYVGAIN